MIDPASLATDDPLGIGGLLIDASRLQQLGKAGQLANDVLGAAVVGLRAYQHQADLAAPADRRLAFRELGLAIGLAAEPLPEFRSLRERIESFWIDPRHRQTALVAGA